VKLRPGFFQDETEDLIRLFLVVREGLAVDAGDEVVDNDWRLLAILPEVD